MNTTYYFFANLYTAINENGDFMQINPIEDHKNLVYGNSIELKNAYSELGDDQITKEEFDQAYKQFVQVQLQWLKY